jgi:hypothetical protein
MPLSANKIKRYRLNGISKSIMNQGNLQEGVQITAAVKEADHFPKKSRMTIRARMMRPISRAARERGGRSQQVCRVPFRSSNDTIPTISPGGILD